jgi:taurine dioxygenase
LHATALRTREPAFSIKPGRSPLGAEVIGIDLSQELDEVSFKELEASFYRHAVLVFRKQKISPAQHVSFSRRFGELEIHVTDQFLLKDHPEIIVISNVLENGRNIGVAEAGRVWHTDLSYVPKPSLGSLLYAIEVPQGNGQPLGDTLFASTTAAYDALPESMRQRLHGLKAIHNFVGYNERVKEKTGAVRAPLTDEQKKKVPDVIHPVIRTHPYTGRKCLYVNDGLTVGIVGMPEDESNALLKELCAHCVRPEFVYRHRWQAGDLLMWDNTATQHFAVRDYALPQRRLMYRTTVAGSVPY